MKFEKPIVLLLIILTVYLSYDALLPAYEGDSDSNATLFSTDRAFQHVKNISKEPHAVGFENHKEVRSYISNELEKLGLEVTIQEGYAMGDWGNLSKASNILARIKGSAPGKALMLLTHYDSSPHSSLGASDAGSGVATILEGTRAFLAQNKTPKNDIIILFSDAEELGLNGAELFVNQHEWAKDVGLVMNFEARGSGGPSYMLLETNQGNSSLIEHFGNADVTHPVGNSLAYSIYKMLPNDTDLTVFRKDGDIDGFNFAFIDDHYDYHTALDISERLNLNTLAHQGSYLIPLLDYFSENSLNELKSSTDNIYFNLPFFKFVSYPFSWIWPMFAIAVFAFIALLIYGFKNKSLHYKLIIKGFIPMVLILVLNGIIGFYGWQVITNWYPAYEDILHGFTYNGHTYIYVFVFLSLSICFLIYNRFYTVSTPNLIVAPIFLLLLICGFASYYLPGSGFLILPVYGLLASFLICMQPEKPNLFILFFLSVLGIAMFSPFVAMFPIGLGLKMIVATTILSSLLFFLVLPVFHKIQYMTRLAAIFLILAVAFLVEAHNNADFSGENPKPSSLLYVYDADVNEARWSTYDHVMIEWNEQFVGNLNGANSEKNTISSKYSSGLKYGSKAPEKDLQQPVVVILRDSLIENKRNLKIAISHQRPVNRLDVFANIQEIEAASANGIPLSNNYLKKRKNKLITHFVSDNDSTLLELIYSQDQKLELTLLEASNDLLTNKQFSVPERPANSIPMPFVLNDAIVIRKTVSFE